MSLPSSKTVQDSSDVEVGSVENDATVIDSDVGSKNGDNNWSLIPGLCALKVARSFLHDPSCREGGLCACAALP